MEFKTLSSRDPEFHSYLRGTFSKTERALPVQSLNVDTESETVTFQIVPVKDIPRPGFFSLWAQVFRVRNFLYVLFPLYLIIVKNSFDEVPWDPDLAWLATFGALSLMIGAFLMNDYLDHVKGVDRVHPEAGSRAIQKGWVTAESTRRWSWFYLVLGGFLGLPAVWVFPELLWLLSIPALVALLSWIFPRIGLKYRRGAEFVVFLLFGPLLTLGFQIAIGGGFDLEALWIGVLTGWHFTFLVHLKNFESIMVNSQAGFGNTMAHLGFERAKRYLEIWWIAFIALMAAYQWIFHSPDWFLGMAVVPVVFSFPFLLELRKLKSPAGSSLAKTVKLARTAALLTLLVWALQSFWYWLVIELGSAS
jgi:1,4-dihydroxy-2-naphthoate octaprenyltransferase